MKLNQFNWNSNFNTKSEFLYLFALVVILKTVLSYIVPVIGDEAYYWFWGNNLQLSYYDHPAGVGFFTWVSVQIQNIFAFLPSWFTLRLPFILLSTATLLIWVNLYKKEFKTSDGIFFFILLYLLNPLLGFGGILATPDVPLLFFWTLSYYSVVQILNTQQTKWYAALGLFLGLGFCSKYHIVLFPITMLVSLLFLKRLKEINFYKLGITIFVGLIFSLPVLIWNYQNEWVSFLFQINHGLNAKKFDYSWPLSYLIGQIFLFNPILFFALFKSTSKSLNKYMSLSHWGFFIYSSTRALVEANWPIAAHPHGLLSLQESYKKYFKPAVCYWLIIWFTFVFLFFTDYGQKKLERLPQSIAANEIYSQVSDFKPLYGPSYQMASLLTFVSGENIPKLYNLSRFDFYDTLEVSKPTANQYYVLKYRSTQWPSYIASMPQSPELIKTLEKYYLELYLVRNE